MNRRQAELIQAAANAKAARARLAGTSAVLQARLKPEVLVRDARREFNGARRNAERAALRNPRVAIGGTVAVALLALRRPIFRLFRRRPKPAK